MQEQIRMIRSEKNNQCYKILHINCPMTTIYLIIVFVPKFLSSFCTYISIHTRIKLFELSSSEQRRINSGIILKLNLQGNFLSLNVCLINWLVRQILPFWSVCLVIIGVAEIVVKTGSRGCTGSGRRRWLSPRFV